MKNDKFDVTVKKNHNVYYLSITHNGLHWTSIHIDNIFHEIPMIINELSSALCKEINKPTPRITWPGDKQEAE